MYRIVSADWLAPAIKRFVIEAPRVARKQEAGQFVILRVHEQGERIPLTIADADAAQGTVTLIVQGVGKTTRLLNQLEAGDAVLDLVGPLGCASEVERFGTVVVIGGGVGTAIAYPTARAFARAGNTVLGIVGARNQELVILEPDLRAICHELAITTDDGSAGEQGLVTDPLQRWLDAGRTIDRVLAIGPVPMMRAVAEVTRPLGIPTIVSLNALMVDGTGMCGGCRVITSTGAKFACVDGPEFDAHTVDFAILMQRNRMYRASEAEALAAFEAQPERAVASVREGCRLAAHRDEVSHSDRRATSATAPSEEAR